MAISSAAFSVFVYYQKSYTTGQLKSEMYENVRGVVELMAQEIGQAGLVTLPAARPTLSAGVTASVSAQTATVSSTTSMFVGEKLIVDTGANEEVVTLTGVVPASNQIGAIFNVNHATGAPINVQGVFPYGIVTPGTTNGSTGTSTGSYTTTVTEPANSVLNMFGDINGDGTLVYVRYTCNTNTTPGTLSRSVTTISPGNNTISTSQTLLNTLVTNPGGTACFQYTTQQVSYSQTVGTGTGSQTAFSTTMGNIPVGASSVSVSAGAVTGTDNGSGSITGTGISSGTINYATGALSVTFSSAPASGTAITAAYRGQSLVTNIALTLSVRTLYRDPQSRQYLTMTKSFLNLAPRNILTALKLANASVTNRLQPTPANVLLY